MDEKQVRELKRIIKKDWSKISPDLEDYIADTVQSGDEIMRATKKIEKKKMPDANDAVAAEYFAIALYLWRGK
jgi:t-SNARE complex subunit (syntaxin)